jgi:hypothetical protein
LQIEARRLVHHPQADLAAELVGQARIAVIGGAAQDRPQRRQAELGGQESPDLRLNRTRVA